MNTKGWDATVEYGAFVWRERDKNYVSQYFMFLPKGVSHSIIAHETVHVINSIFQDRGIVLDTKNDEPQAYLTGWVAKQVYMVMDGVKTKRDY
ncbi:hypothetical protein [Mucilaginibacter sp. 10I4]|uniref:hypothetical protein n=1 Tax=Mucilaginibacter sp. 10I4 TaxID=3048580 RepID=UPI002B2281BD|nr:hypothetical protein [Mucilaginibacter sp. 10I4]MEB0264077.1 hypothetical protein [Mucilaginibacter sp. 10I4]